MNLRQIESLVWLARLRSFRAAAAHLHATQPAISVRIQELEKELGVTLIDRSRRAVSLTAEGRECLAYAEQIVTWSTELRARLGRRSLSGRVNLGVSEVIAHTWLPLLLATLDRTYPDVQIDTTINMTPALLQGLEAGDYDVILVGADRLTTTHSVLDLGKVAFVWLGRDWIGGKPPPYKPGDLGQSRVITWSKDAAIYPSIEDWFIRHGSHPMQRITCNTAATMATLAAAGLGITLLPTELVRPQLAAGTLRVLVTEPEFEPLRYWAIHVPTRQGALGRIVAQVANEVSSFDR